ncbi:MAG TPA: hypothetical protein VJS68_00615 [Thermoplasmata archaeon]|nr:hypothetical protein [Thermoplasmata archaeon]
MRIFLSAIGGFLLAVGVSVAILSWFAVTACTAFNAGGCHPAGCQVYELCPVPEMLFGIGLAAVGGVLLGAGIWAKSSYHFTSEFLADHRT